MRLGVSAYIGLAWLCLSVTNPALGEDVSPVLWRDLQAGRSAEQVAKLVAAYPEVKSVKLKAGTKKPPTITVKMKSGGIAIFGSAFSVGVDITKDNHLANVSLASSSECASGATEKFGKISASLAEKYGPEKTGRAPVNDFTIRSALLKSLTSERSEISTYGYDNGSIVVVFVAGFIKNKAPAYPYGGGSFVRALYDVAKAMYDAERSRCGNTGDERVVFALQYMTKAAFDQQAGQIQERRDEEGQKAREDL